MTSLSIAPFATGKRHQKLVSVEIAADPCFKFVSTPLVGAEVPIGLPCPACIFKCYFAITGIRLNTNFCSEEKAPVVRVDLTQSLLRVRYLWVWRRVL